jgi:hypothetical protein
MYLSGGGGHHHHGHHGGGGHGWYGGWGGYWDGPYTDVVPVQAAPQNDLCTWLQGLPQPVLYGGLALIAYLLFVRK